MSKASLTVTLPVGEWKQVRWALGNYIDRELNYKGVKHQDLINIYELLDEMIGQLDKNDG